VVSSQPEPRNVRSVDASPPTSTLRSGSASGRSARDAVWLAVCAWCGRARLDGRWTDGTETLASYEPFVTHGICPACLSTMERHADSTQRQPRSV
jgi:hypothetical protein